MSNIFSQLNPTVWIALLVLLLGSIGGIYVLRLVRKGAKKPGDIVQATKEKMDQKKARKEAVKQAEAAIAAPVASSRLSRIGVRGNENVNVDTSDETAMETVSEPGEAQVAEDIPEQFDPFKCDRGDEALTAEHDREGSEQQFVSDDDVTDPTDTPLFDASEEQNDDPAEYGVDASVAFDAAETAAEDGDDAPDGLFEPEAEPVAEMLVEEETGLRVEDEIFEQCETAPNAASDALDLAHSDNHPRDWDQLIAMINVLDSALKRSWSEDHLAPSLRVRLAAAKAAAGSDSANCPMCRSLSQQLAATDLARTINSAAREQAAEIVAAVREFAHSTDFTAQDCSAVMGALAEIEWMALIVRDDGLEKRTISMTRHDPDAPLWVSEAWTVMRQEPSRRAA